MRRGPVSVVLLAGDRGAGDPVAAAAGVAHKCLAHVAGRAMVERVYETLAAAPSIGAIAIVAPEGAELNQRSALAGARFAAMGPTPATSAGGAIAVLGFKAPILIATADSPLLTVEIVEGFLAGAARAECDVAVGLAPERAVKARSGAARRTYLRFRDGGYSGCNLFAIAHGRGLGAIDFWRRVERDRKAPWRIARAFGWGSLVLFLARRLTLEAAVARAGEAMGVVARPVVLEDGEAAIDVDKPEDLTLAEALLAARRD